MTELIIIKTNNSQELKKLLEKKHIDYEIYQGKPQKISEAELGQAYKEAWSNPRRYQEAQK